MNYKRIKFELRGYENTLYRDFLIREDVNLLELGIILVDSVYGELNHLFCFRNKTRTFVTENQDMTSPNTLYMSDYHLNDLGNNFTFIYDYGEDWIFDCNVEDKTYHKPGNDFVHILNGAGLAIFEDNRELFELYVGGELSLDEIDEEMVWNTDIADFNNYDVECEDKRIRDMIPFAIYSYIADCQNAGYELNIKNINLDDYKSQEEIDEYLDYENDEDNDDFDMIQMAFLESANYLIENTEFGKEEYNRLIKNHEDLEVRAIFMKELLSLVKDAMHGENNEFNEKLYKALRKEK